MGKLRIREIIKERGISVGEFAESLGIERQNVYNVFEKPSWKRLEQCSEILNIPIRDLFVIDEECEINGYIEYKGKIFKIPNTETAFKVFTDILSDISNIEKDIK